MRSACHGHIVLFEKFQTELPWRSAIYFEFPLLPSSANLPYCLVAIHSKESGKLNPLAISHPRLQALALTQWEMGHCSSVRDSSHKGLTLMLFETTLWSRAWWYYSLSAWIKVLFWEKDVLLGGVCTIYFMKCFLKSGFWFIILLMVFHWGHSQPLKALINLFFNTFNICMKILTFNRQSVFTSIKHGLRIVSFVHNTLWNIVKFWKGFDEKWLSYAKGYHAHHGCDQLHLVLHPLGY